MRLALMIMLIMCLPTFVRASHAFEFGRDVERDFLGLNGTWEVSRGDGSEEMWRPQTAARATWTPVEVPGNLNEGLDREGGEKVRFVWVRKSFTLDGVHGQNGVVLRWNGIRFGASAWVNGHKVAEHSAIGPAQILLPPGVVKVGKNGLLLKVAGWSGVAKNKAGKPLMPTGGSTQSWGSKQAVIFYDVWLEFYYGVYMKWVLAIPDVTKGTVTFRVWPHVDEKYADERIDLRAVVRPWKKASVVGSQKTSVTAKQPRIDITVPIENVKLWSLEQPNLYEGEIEAATGAKVRDRVRLRFGMRELTVRDGHYMLNGRRFRFYGSNLVNEWHWGRPFGDSIFNKSVKRYIVDEACLMSLNSFRTHTCPPPHLWLDVADEHGTLFLAEFPVLYNYGNFHFTKKDLEVWHRNAITDATGWVTTLWNHPSVVIWVLSNESRYDNAWEAGPFRDHVVSLDPTRTTLRTGTGTKSNEDIHTCGNYARNAEGYWLSVFEDAMKTRDLKRPLTNTEYMNRFGDPPLRYLGRSRHPDAALEKAECAMEHTEAMRRLDYDGLFPYMYAGWTGLRTGRQWRQDFPTPMAASLHSCMSPVLASIDLYDRNFTPAQEMTTPVVLINDTDEEVSAKLEFTVTAENPLMVPDEDVLKGALWKQSHDVTLKAQSHGELPLVWKLPDKEGQYYVAAVLRRQGERPVVSQRVVRAIAAEPLDGRLRGQRVLVLGGPQRFGAWLKRRGARTTTLGSGKIDADVVVVWDPKKVPDAQRKMAPAILDFVKAGGRLVALDPPQWYWDELIDFQTRDNVASRAFAYPDAKHPMLRGIRREFLMRWNGRPNAVTKRRLHGDLLEKGTKLLWSGKPENTVAHNLPIGKGEIVVCLLEVKGRITRSEAKYDPVAERIVTNLLAK